jgi:hypothetical protein
MMFMEAFLLENDSSVTTIATPSLYSISTTIPKYYQIQDNSSSLIVDLSFLLEEKQKMRNLEILKGISELEYNWNNNEAEPFSPNLLSYCRNIINEIVHQPDIFPTGRKSIQMEYEKDNGEYLELEIFENHINLFLIKESGEEIEDVLPLEMTKINEVVLDFHG